MKFITNESKERAKREIQRDLKRDKRAAALVVRIIKFLVIIGALNITLNIALSMLGLGGIAGAAGLPDTRLYPDFHGAGDKVGDRGLGLSA